MEAGKAKLSSVVAVLRELNQLDALDHFIPEPGISPMQLARIKGKTRQRATGKRSKPESKPDQSDDVNEDVW